MAELNRKLLDLFQLSDGLLLPDEAVLEEISKEQQSLRDWNEAIVFQGLSTMRGFLQDLASEDHEGLANSRDEMDWGFYEMSHTELPKRNLRIPSVWELTRHLSNWMLVFIPPVRALDISGDMELVACLESPDHYVAALAAIMLGSEEFNYLGSIEKLKGILNSKRQSALRFEICRLIYDQYHDPQALSREIVPKLITSDKQYDTIFESDVQRKRFLSYIRELVVWDIATKGEGPRRKWPTWWI